MGVGGGNIFKVESHPNENYELTLGNLNLKRDNAIIRTRNKNCSIKWNFELSNMNFYRFCSEGTGERVWLIQNKGLYGVLIRVCMEFDFSSVIVIKSQM